MSQEPLLFADTLCRSFGPHQAVDGISLRLHRGEVLGLLGPNGAGKTTTLRMLTGCLPPDAGQIAIGGFDLRQQPHQAQALLGYLPETPPLHKELTPQEFLGFCAGLHGLRGARRRQAVDAALEACGLQQVSRQLISALSKGYQQRVGLAQAIVHEPPLIVLDEPTVGLDPNQMREIRALIRELARERAILLSSHILSEVQAVCDRVAIMAGGQIVHESVVPGAGDPETGRWRLHFRHPPALDELLALPGVADASPLDSGLIRISAQPGQDPRQAMVLKAVALDWGLLELSPDTPSLEEIFAEVTA